MQASCVALSESRRLFLRSLSLVDRRSLWPQQFQSRDNFSSPARHDSLYLYELPRRLDNRVSSSTALSEARRIYLSLVHCINVYSQVYVIYGYCNFMRVLSLNWNYGMCSARYIYTHIPIYIYIYIYIYRKIAARCTTRLARSRSPIMVLQMWIIYTT